MLHGYHLSSVTILPFKNATEKGLEGSCASLRQGSRVHNLWRHRHLLGLLHGRQDVCRPTGVGRSVHASLTPQHDTTIWGGRERDSLKDTGALSSK